MTVKELIKNLSVFNEDFEICTTIYDDQTQKDKLVDISVFKIDLLEKRVILTNYTETEFY